MKLRIGSDGFTLAAELAADVVAIVGRRGRGKTTTAVVLVEELAGAGARFCVADPVGVWHGLKSSRDGKNPGLPVIVMGGDHGDVPLDETAGKVIADFVAAAIAKVGRNGHGDPGAAQPLRVGPPRPKVEWPRPPARSAATDTDSQSVLRPRHREMLQMLARYEQMGQATIAQERLAVAVGLAPDAGNTRNLLGALHAQGLIERSGGQVRLTPAGRMAAGPADDLGSHDAIMELWRSKLRPRHRQILELLASVYPAPLRPDEIGRHVGLEPESGNFRNILGRLSSLGLIVREQGMLTASENLFP